METKLIEISKLRLDGDTQPRLAINQSVVEDYAEAMSSGRDFPAIKVFHDGAEYWLSDGFHRVHAARKLGLKEIKADVETGVQSEAKWSSLGANIGHGLQRTNADKQNAVIKALRMRPELADRALADHVGVHHSMIARYRLKLAPVAEKVTGAMRQPATCIGRDGRKYQVASNKQRAKRRDVEPRISANAFTPIHGHSKPNPMIAMSLPSHDPVMAARTLIELFDAAYLRTLTAHLNDHLKGIAQ